MIGGFGTLAPRLAGVTARVKATRQGTRVTLGPGGAGRRMAIAVLAMGLIAWAAGEILALGAPAMLLGEKLGPFSGMRTLAGDGMLAAPGCLLVWLAFWTCGGFLALFSLARTVWGVDVLTVSADRWTIWWGIGRWGHGRRFIPKKARRIELRGRAGALVMEIDGRTVILTRFGTDVDRLWLRDLLQDAAMNSMASSYARAKLTTASQPCLSPRTRSPLR